MSYTGVHYRKIQIGDTFGHFPQMSFHSRKPRAIVNFRDNSGLLSLTKLPSGRQPRYSLLILKLCFRWFHKKACIK